MPEQQPTIEIQEMRARAESLNAELVKKLENAKISAFDKVNIMLTMGGLKPAATAELLINRKTEEENTNFMTTEEIDDVLSVIKNSGMAFEIKPREIIRNTYETGASPSQEKIMEDDRIEVLLATSKQNLEILKKSWGTGNNEAIGKALGFPVSSIEAFVGKRRALNLKNLPNEMRKSDALTFFTPLLSENNWQAEMDEGEKRAEFIKKNSLKTYEEMMQIHRKS